MSTQVELSTSMSIKFDNQEILQNQGDYIMVQPSEDRTNKYNLNYIGYSDGKSYSPRPTKKDYSIYIPKYISIDNSALSTISEK